MDKNLLQAEGAANDAFQCGRAFKQRHRADLRASDQKLPEQVRKILAGQHSELCVIAI